MRRLSSELLPWVRTIPLSTDSIESRMLSSSIDKLARAFLIEFLRLSRWSCFVPAGFESWLTKSTAFYDAESICSFDSSRSSLCWRWRMSCSCIIFCYFWVMAAKLSCSVLYCSISSFSFLARSFFFSSCSCSYSVMSMFLRVSLDCWD